MPERRIAIAGCGPCGLAAALLLHRAGFAVEMFERFETPQPVGSGLMIQPTGLAVLAQLGMSERLIAQGQRIDRLYGVAGGQTVLDVRYANLPRKGQFGVGVHRASLFDVLYEAVQAEGVPISTGRGVTASRSTPEGRVLRFADGDESAPFDLVVDALGARSSLAPPVGRDLAYGALWASLDWGRETGLDPHTLSQRYRRASVMAGVLPTGKGRGETARAAFFWSLRADQWADWKARGLEPWKAEVAALWPECVAYLDQIHSPEQLTFARYAHRTLPKPSERGLIHLGDAWHSASPQLGQGANMALLDAWALAQGLKASADMDQAISAAAASRRLHVRLYQALTWIFTPVYQSDSRVLPVLRDRLVGPLSKLWPATALQAAMVSGLIGDPLPGLDLPAYAGPDRPT